MGLAIEGTRYLFAAYALGMSAFGFYVIFLATQTNFINDPKWSDEHKMDVGQLKSLRSLRDDTYQVAIALVVINFFLVVYLIFSKFRVGTRF